MKTNKDTQLTSANDQKNKKIREGKLRMGKSNKLSAANECWEKKKK